MDDTYRKQGILFVWNRQKAKTNLYKHGVSFEQAAEAFFDPFLRVMESGTTEEHRDALLGLDTSGRLLFVVHIEQDEDTFRIISARKATTTEKRYYESN